MSTRLHKVTASRCASLGITAMELTSNHGFPRHTHGEYGIGVILSGAQRSWSGIGPVESLPGDVITVNPGELHDGHPINGAVRCWRIIYFDPDFLARYLVPDTGRQIEFVSPNLRDRELGTQVNLLFNRLRPGADRLAVEEIVVPLVRRLVSGHHPERHTRTGSGPVTKARERIDDDPSREITLSELATLSGVSRYQIVRAFARELGVTPHAYVVQRRVRLARQLLLSGTTLADAAQQAGFADQSHLTRAFARQIGIPPGRYLAAGAVHWRDQLPAVSRSR
jgi:AraC-like DNA-binding protein